jgi:hypothetical protein
LSTVALDPLFTAEDAEAFTERHIASLAAGTLAAVRIPSLLSPQACASALDAVETLPTQRSTTLPAYPCASPVSARR